MGWLELCGPRDGRTAVKLLQGTGLLTTPVLQW